jgi:probable LLM family oxidoreductase
MTTSLQFGLDTFGDVTVDESGRPLSHGEVLANMVTEAELADQVGVDFIGVGEHHRSDFAVSAPEVVLAAMASRTTRIGLGSAVTVLSSDDPVRVFQRFSTLDGLSSGRAEVTLGRGSFTESFPLFGYALDDYEVLFEEKVGLFAELVKQEPLHWSGSTRAPLENQAVFPRMSHTLPVWLGVGGSPESVVRAARYGFGLMLAIIGGSPDRFEQYVDLFERAQAHFGVEGLPVGVHSPGYVAETDQQALEEYWPHYQAMHARIGAERGWGPMRFEQFVAGAGPQGSLYVGSPETVATKIAATVKTLRLNRFDLKYSAGTLPHERMMSCIGLYGTEVIPRVRELVGETVSA